MDVNDFIRPGDLVTPMLYDGEVNTTLKVLAVRMPWIEVVPEGEFTKPGITRKWINTNAFLAMDVRTPPPC